MYVFYLKSNLTYTFFHSSIKVRRVKHNIDTADLHDFIEIPHQINNKLINKK